MNKQGPGKIDYLDWVWNCVKGLCKRNCDYCFMQRYYKRFKLNPEIRFDEKELKCKFPVKPSRIGISFNHDLFGEWIPSEWIYQIIKRTEENPQHTFVFLTKYPSRYNDFKFPKNCWLGTTIDGTNKTIDNLWKLGGIHNSNLKYLSLEPLLEIERFKQVNWDQCNIDWIIIGADTNANAKRPPLVWCDMFNKLARRLEIPLWIKNSFIKMGYPIVIKELPGVKK